VDHPAVAAASSGTGTRLSRRRFGALLTLGVVLAGSVACGSSAVEPTASSAPTTTTTPPPPPPPPPVLWPLTGLESGQVPPRPALAVKIENSVDARPQTGLNAADMVWEEVVEGGITRYVAVYHSTLPPEIGPVRSIRPMDPAIAAPLHGLFAFSGGQRPFVDAVAAAGLQVVSHDAGASGFHRINSRSAPHNVYADPAALLEQADPAHLAAPAPQFDFAEAGAQPTAVTGGTPTAAVQLTLSRSSHPVWTWSAPDARWVRAEGTTPAVEADGTPLRAANVVVLRVDIVNTVATDVAGTAVPETVLVGSGEALVATGGSTIPARWVKHAVGDRLFLTGPDGNPLRLAAGNTWVELVPNGTGAVTVG
jgi:hypothetical protein